MIKWVCFDLDDTLFNGTLLVDKARRASVEMMLEYGLPVDKEYAISVLYEIVNEFGSNSENHLDNLIIRLRNDPDVKLSSKYNINKLVYYEIIEDAYSAIKREKQIKGGSRKKKNDLIENMNASYKDLFANLLN